MMIASTRLAIARSGSFIFGMASSRRFLPSSLVFCAFSSRAYSFIAARSSAENFPDDEFLGALVAFAVVFLLFVLVVFAAMAVHLRGIVDGNELDQDSCWMRSRLPAGSRNAQSRTPYGWSVGSWTTSAS